MKDLLAKEITRIADERGYVGLDLELAIEDLSELAEFVIKQAAERIEKVCDGYIKYGNEAPAMQRDWGLVTADTARRIKVAAIISMSVKSEKVKP